MVATRNPPDFSLSGDGLVARKSAHHEISNIYKYRQYKAASSMIREKKSRTEKFTKPVRLAREARLVDFEMKMKMKMPRPELVSDRGVLFHQTTVG